MMLRREEFDVLDELRKTGPLPRELEQRYQKLRREQLFRAGLHADRYPPPSTSRLENADMTIADWLKERWRTTDAIVRHSLRLLADALGIPLPLRRTRRIPPQGSSPTRRTKIAPQPCQDELELLADPAGRKQRGYHDPPEWDDELADGWEPSESLTDALHDALDPEDRGWY